MENISRVPAFEDFVTISTEGSMQDATIARLQSRVSSKQTNKFRFEPKQTETRSVSRLFLFVSWNPNFFFSVCFGVSNLYRNNRNKQNCFETNRNNPEFSENTKICSLNTTNLQRLRINKKKPFELSTMQGTETIPNLFTKKPKSFP